MRRLSLSLSDRIGWQANEPAIWLLQHDAELVGIKGSNLVSAAQGEIAFAITK